MFQLNIFCLWKKKVACLLLCAVVGGCGLTGDSTKPLYNNGIGYRHASVNGTSSGYINSVLQQSIFKAFPDKYSNQYFVLSKSTVLDDDKRWNIREILTSLPAIKFMKCNYTNGRSSASVIFVTNASGPKLNVNELHNIDPKHPYLFIGPPIRLCPKELNQAKAIVEKNFTPHARQLSKSQPTHAQYGSIIKKMAEARIQKNGALLANDDFILDFHDTAQQNCSKLNIRVEAETPNKFASNKHSLHTLLKSLPAAIEQECPRSQVDNIRLIGTNEKVRPLVRLYDAEMKRSNNWNIEEKYVFEKTYDIVPICSSVPSAMSDMGPLEQEVAKLQSILGLELEFGYQANLRNIEDEPVDLMKITKVCKNNLRKGRRVNVGTYLMVELEQRDPAKFSKITAKATAQSTPSSFVENFGPLLAEMQLIDSEGKYNLAAVYPNSNMSISITPMHLELPLNEKLANDIYQTRLAKFTKKVQLLQTEINNIPITKSLGNYRPVYAKDEEPLNLKSHLASIYPFGEIQLSPESVNQHLFISNGVEYSMEDLIFAYNAFRLPFLQSKVPFYRNNTVYFKTDDEKLYFMFVSVPENDLTSYIPKQLVITEITQKQQNLLKLFDDEYRYFEETPTSTYFSKSFKWEGKNRYIDMFFPKHDFFRRVVPATRNDYQYWCDRCDFDFTIVEPLNEFMSKYFDKSLFYQNIKDATSKERALLVAIPSLTKKVPKKITNYFVPSQLFLSKYNYQQEFKKWVEFDAYNYFARTNGLVQVSDGYWQGFSNKYNSLKNVFTRSKVQRNTADESMLDLISTYYTQKRLKCGGESNMVKYTRSSYFVSEDDFGYTSRSLVDSKDFYVPQTYFPLFDEVLTERNRPPAAKNVLSSVLSIAKGNTSLVDAAMEDIVEFTELENDTRQFLQSEDCESPALLQYENHLELYFFGKTDNP